METYAIVALSEHIQTTFGPLRSLIVQITELVRWKQALTNERVSYLVQPFGVSFH